MAMRTWDRDTTIEGGFAAQGLELWDWNANPYHICFWPSVPNGVP